MQSMLNPLVHQSPPRSSEAGHPASAGAMQRAGTADLGTAGRTGSYSVLPTSDPDGPAPEVKSASSLAAASKRRAYFKAVLVMAACIFWLVCSSTIILANKVILVNFKFPYPMAIAAMGMGFSSIGCIFYIDILGMIPSVGAVDTSFYLFKVIPIGLIQAITLALGNKCYLLLTVAFIEMARATLPVLTMLALWACKLDYPTRDVFKAVGLTAVGCAVAAYGEVHLTALGAFYMGTNLLMETVRMTMTQFLLTGVDLHPLQTLKLIAPPATIGLLLGSYFQEYPVMLKANSLAVPLEHPWYFLMAASLGMIVNVLAVVIIKTSTATTLKVLAAVRGPIVVLLGVLLFAEHVSMIEFAGYSVALVGFVWYNYAKSAQALAAKAAKANTK